MRAGPPMRDIGTISSRTRSPILSENRQGWHSKRSLAQNPKGPLPPQRNPGGAGAVGSGGRAMAGPGRWRFAGRTPQCILQGMPKRSSKKNSDEAQHLDENELAAPTVEQVTGKKPPESESGEQGSEKNPAAVALGRLGGKKGGPARAAKLSREERSRIAKKAAQARWDKDRS